MRADDPPEQNRYATERETNKDENQDGKVVFQHAPAIQCDLRA